MKKILIPHDFTESSENALEYAISLAKDLSGSLILMHVSAYPVVSPEIGLSAYTFQDARGDSLKALNELAEKIKKREPLLQVECSSVIGDATTEVVGYTAEHPVDFIVMGIGGHGNKFLKNIIGSVSVSVSKKTTDTVIIVPPGVTYKKPKSMALAYHYDENTDHDPYIEKAKRISSLFNADLQILHVVPEGHHFAPTEVVIDNYTEHKLENSPHRLFIITEKKVSQGLLGMLENKLIDMILVAPKEHNFIYKLFHESITSEIAFFSPVPVMTIHAG
jgi:nucleotide-binding universal stress UspA family protein